MPVHLACFYREVLLVGKVATNSTNETDSQEKYTNGDVEAVKTCQGEESRTKGAIPKAKMLTEEADIFVDLSTKEDETHDDGGRQTKHKISLVSSYNARACPDNGTLLRSRIAVLKSGYLQSRCSPLGSTQKFF